MTSKPKVDRTILFSRTFVQELKNLKINHFLLFVLECEFFIDYRSTQTGCDRSLRLGNQLQTNYGAKIIEVPDASSTTHIIYKNGSLQTKLFAKKYNLPLIDPLWLEKCINKRRLVKFHKYRVEPDDDDDEENQQPVEDLRFEQLTTNDKELIGLSTPKMKVEVFLL